MDNQTVRCGLIQLSNPVNDESVPVADIQKAMLDKHIPYIEEAGKKGVQILCLQEIFNGPYFCPSQDPRWYAAAEPCPGPTTKIMQEYAKKYQMVIVVPIYEEAMRGVYYNTAAVIDADGTYMGKYRKQHIPQTNPGSGRSTSSSRATAATPSSTPSTPRSASTSATTGTSPRGGVRSGLNGAEVVFNPSATVAGLSQYLWKLEQPAAAVANTYFVGAINRVGSPRPPGASASSTARATSSIPRGQFLVEGQRRRRRAGGGRPRPLARSTRSARPGSSTAIAAQRRTASWSSNSLKSSNRSLRPPCVLGRRLHAA